MDMLRRLGLVASVSVLCLGCGGDDDDDGSPASGGAGGGSASGGSAGTSNSGGSGGTDASLCEEGCVATMAAACSNGPPDQAQCEADCEAMRNGPCATEYQALQTCAEGQPITCDANGFPVIEACSTEYATFVACLS